MDAFELNKIAGAILGSLMLAVVLNIGSGAVFSRPKTAKPGYVIPVPSEAASAEASKQPAPAVEPIGQRLASADAKRGQADVKPCEACHNFEKGAGIKVGPPLYGVVGREKASVKGFDYSDALKSKGGAWTYADLDQFITNPRAYAPGTKMTFAGESDPAQRANIIDYLRGLSDNPEPLPAIAAASSQPAPAVPPIEQRLAAADEKKGQADVKPCEACHNFEKGAGVKVGPPLYGVVGRAKASVKGFDYSDALKSKGGTWTYADLDQWLANPRAYAPGTKMTFAGESDPAQRANIIDYLRGLSDNPEPLPAK